MLIKKSERNDAIKCCDDAFRNFSWHNAAKYIWKIGEIKIFSISSSILHFLKMFNICLCNKYMHVVFYYIFGIYLFEMPKICKSIFCWIGFICLNENFENFEINVCNRNFLTYKRCKLNFVNIWNFKITRAICWTQCIK